MDKLNESLKELKRIFIENNLDSWVLDINKLLYWYFKNPINSLIRLDIRHFENNFVWSLQTDWLKHNNYLIDIKKLTTKLKNILDTETWEIELYNDKINTHELFKPWIEFLSKFKDKMFELNNEK